jgi:LDH2 family malate/lactate/ureidoglycolate dehydrogenase
VTPALRASDAVGFVTALLQKCGSPPRHATAVAEHLVESSRLGVHSHGLIRVPQYVKEIRAGDVDPGARPRQTRKRGAVTWVGGNSCFGQVGGIFCAGRAVAAAREHGIGLVLANRLGHTGRLGAYAELIAAAGCMGLVFGAGPRRGHIVAPFGGIEGRLSTNPIAFAVPNGATPVVADFATSQLPEGKVRSTRNRRLRLPPGVLQDADGNPTDDPAVLYGRPRGTLLPLGGPAFGHKGYALGILVEAMATLLAGDDAVDASRSGFNLAILAIATRPGFETATARMVDYLRSSRPADPSRPVLVPGDPERVARGRDIVEVDAQTWGETEAIARELGIEVPPVASRS